MNLRQLVVLSATTATIFGSSAALAITTVETNAGLQFNFSNPGARSLAMGGAFLGLADDATAAYSNPAGLSNLFRPEFSLEFRRNEYTTVFADTGRLYGEPTGVGIDVNDSIVFGESQSDTDSLSFISFVYPLEYMTIGAYRHEIANFSAAYRRQGPIVQSVDQGRDLPFLSKEGPTENATDMDIINWGISLSYRITDSLAVGAGLSYYEFSFDSLAVRYPAGSFEQRYEPADFTADPRTTAIQTGDDDDIGYNFGLLWSISSRWSLGVVYRTGAEFDYDHQVANLINGVTRSSVTDFNLPGKFGAGIAFRPIEQLTLTFDYNRISYSDLTKNVVLEGTDTDFPFIEVDDGDEYRLGAEFVFATSVPLAVRAGIWNAPDTQLAYVGPLGPATPDLTPAELQQTNIRNTRAAYFQPGDEETHWSLGFGMVFNRFQLDAAADFSDNNDTYSVSGVFFF